LALNDFKTEQSKSKTTQQTEVKRVKQCANVDQANKTSIINQIIPL